MSTKQKNADPTPTMSSTPWMVGVFCDECGTPWAEKAPCPHCGEFAHPEARIFRQVMKGKALLPWTWERGYEFSDATPGAPDADLAVTTEVEQPRAVAV